MYLQKSNIDNIKAAIELISIFKSEEILHGNSLTLNRKFENIFVVFSIKRYLCTEVVHGYRFYVIFSPGGYRKFDGSGVRNSGKLHLK